MASVIAKTLSARRCCSAFLLIRCRAIAPVAVLPGETPAYNFPPDYLTRNPVNGLVADAALSLSASPISHASGPTLMALNAFANCARSGV